MRVARVYLIVATVLLFVLQIIPITVQPYDTGEEGKVEYVAVLCGTITQDTETFLEFYVTCDVNVQAGVNLTMIGIGYVSPLVGIDV
ncbi:MAG: hypothetical protein JSV43_08035 [Methanobacteriota archaeon]|nr:MAG: hypothetical protein JSV43_08035 [Euryarchaeota archaeon]